MGIDFSRADKPFQGANIGQAMQALRLGKKVRRAAWPDAKQIDFFYLVNASCFTVNRPPLAPTFQGEQVSYAAHIDAFFKVPEGTAAAGTNIVKVWVDEHEDLFATDWYVVE